MRKLKIEPKGTMRIGNVDFTFEDSRDTKNYVVVRFCHDEKGRPDIIVFFVATGKKKSRYAEDYVIDNRNGRYKPCATHAAEIVRTLTYKPPKTNFARRRLKDAKPALKVFA